MGAAAIGPYASLRPRPIPVPWNEPLFQSIFAYSAELAAFRADLRSWGTARADLRIVASGGPARQIVVEGRASHRCDIVTVRDATEPRLHEEELREMAGLLRRVVGRKVEVELELGEGMGPVVVDRERLQQALLNVAANARDAMPAGGGNRAGT